MEAQQLEAWHCDNVYDASSTFTGQDCVVTAYATTSPPNASSTIQYTGPNIHEWLVVAGVLIFLVSTLAWEKIFKFMKS